MCAQMLATGAHAQGDLAHELARYVAEIEFDALDQATIETVKSHLIDALGCGVAAYGEAPVRACRTVALSSPGGPSTVIGTQRRTSPDLATFANGAAFRYYDFNDVYIGREPGHPSDNITACLAVAEAENRSGRDLLVSIVLAYEIACRLMDAAELTRMGWDHPIYSLPAAALAAGKLMRLPTEQLAQAVNLAVNGHIAMNQTRVQVLSDWKGLADADAARNGVFAALLARQGVTGPAPVFEGHAGLFKQVSGPFALEVNEFGGKGGGFRIHDCGVKLYPAQGGTLTAIPAAGRVAAQVGDLDQISSVEIATTQFTYLSAGRDPEKWAPETKETADHSLPYIVARAMLDGEITNDSYSATAIRDSRVRALLKKISVKPDEALTRMSPRAIPNRVSAVLHDGRVISHQVDTIPGLAGMPMKRADFERKFRKNVAKVWNESKQDQVLDYIWNIDQQTSLQEFFSLTVIEG
ncbi:MmgE/PrpD family protein [Bradyrhizobium erythrophlei]|uniref:MmgE/PrpD family protein n=1 Tax=Bradyrhizobium erythrophlei TaxID=1437360 RepID=UPI0035EDFB1B